MGRHRRTSACCSILSFLSSPHASSTFHYASAVVMNTLSSAFSTQTTSPPVEAPKVVDNHYIVFGLGNIGSTYVNTRHNIGRDLIHKLSDELQSPLVNKKYVCDYSNKIPFGNRTITLAVPDTYMNISGKSVRNLSESLQTPHKNIIVIHDDLDLPVGQIRIRDKGSSGGQNGIKDILKFIGNEAPFTRVKVGIGRPANRDADISDYVLSKFNTNDREALKFVREHAWEVVKLVIEEGAERANNKVQLQHRNHLIATGKLVVPSKKTKEVTYTYDPSRVQSDKAGSATTKKKKEDPFAALARRRPGMSTVSATAATNSGTPAAQATTTPDVVTTAVESVTQSVAESVEKPPVFGATADAVFTQINLDICIDAGAEISTGVSAADNNAETLCPAHQDQTLLEPEELGGGVVSEKADDVCEVEEEKEIVHERVHSQQ